MTFITASVQASSTCSPEELLPVAPGVGDEELLWSLGVNSSVELPPKLFDEFSPTEEKWEPIDVVGPEVASAVEDGIKDELVLVPPGVGDEELLWSCGVEDTVELPPKLFDVLSASEEKCEPIDASTPDVI